MDVKQRYFTTVTVVSFAEGASAAQEEDKVFKLRSQSVGAVAGIMSVE